MNPPIRLLCIDDNPLIAQSLHRRLELESDLAWVGWVQHSADALCSAGTALPHIILLDIDMPDHDAFNLTREFGKLLPDAKVVMFSGHVRSDLIDRAVDAGAWGYLSKNDTMADLLSAIRRVAAGEFVLSPDVAIEHGRIG